MGYQDRSEYAENNMAFRTQIRYAMQNAAQMIMGEAPSTEHHQERCDFALIVMRNGYNVNSITLVITTNGTVGAAIDGTTDHSNPDAPNVVSDTDTQNAVNSLWNHWAGIITTT